MERHFELTGLIRWAPCHLCLGGEPDEDSDEDSVMARMDEDSECGSYDGEDSDEDSVAGADTVAGADAAGADAAGADAVGAQDIVAGADAAGADGASGGYSIERGRQEGSSLTNVRTWSPDRRFVYELGDSPIADAIDMYYLGQLE